MNKKASIIDPIVAMILSFILVVICGVVWYAVGEVNTGLENAAPMIQEKMPYVNVSETITNTVGAVLVAYETFTWITVMLIFGYFLSVLISAFLVKTHPVWFVAYILVTVLAVILSVPISNTYEELVTNPTLASTWINFPGANYIFYYLPLWMAVFGIIAGILMYINIDWGGSYR